MGESRASRNLLRTGNPADGLIGASVKRVKVGKGKIKKVSKKKIY